MFTTAIRVSIDPDMASHPQLHGRIDVDCDVLKYKPITEQITEEEKSEDEMGLEMLRSFLGDLPASEKACKLAIKNCGLENINEAINMLYDPDLVAEFEKAADQVEEEQHKEEDLHRLDTEFQMILEKCKVDLKKAKGENKGFSRLSGKSFIFVDANQF